MTMFKLLNIHIAVLIIFFMNSSNGYERSFEYDPSWPHLTIGNLPLYGTAIVQDFENNLIVLNRGANYEIPDRNETIFEVVVLVIDHVTGERLRQWGDKFFYHPHGLEVASNGDIFITDSHLHQVFKFAYIPATKLWNTTPIMTLGERLVSGSGPSHFYSPADVAIEPETENFYVADGFGNTRVVKFDSSGNYLLEFSAGSASTPIIPFNIVHMLTVAVRHTYTGNRALRRSITNDDVVVAVADRNNFRIQYFSGNGSFLYEQTAAELGIPSTWLMSVAHVDVNSNDEPYNADVVDADFGIVYAVDVGTDTIPPVVNEIAVGWSNATIISRFTTNKSDSYVRRGLVNDIAVSKTGDEVYVVISNSTSLIIKRFLMTSDSSASMSVSGIFVLVMAYLSTSLLSN